MTGWTLTNSTEFLEGLSAFTPTMVDEIMTAVDDVLADPEVGEPDDFVPRSSRVQVRDRLWLLYEADEPTRTVDVLSIEVGFGRSLI